MRSSAAPSAWPIRLWNVADLTESPDNVDHHGARSIFSGFLGDRDVVESEERIVRRLAPEDLGTVGDLTWAYLALGDEGKAAGLVRASLPGGGAQLWWTEVPRVTGVSRWMTDGEFADALVEWRALKARQSEEFRLELP